MNKITVEKPDKKTLEKLGVTGWPTWEKDASSFNWTYDQTEVCYILKGVVIVTTLDGTKVEFGKGDLVTFPKGLTCTWDVKVPVRKQYNFK